MSPLAKYLFIFMLNHTGPGASVYSFELMPECGIDKENPACKLEPVCPLNSPMCAAPRWSQYRNGWVRVETREQAALRYYNAANALARTATYLTRCKDADGSVLEECEPVFWPSGPRSLACAALSSSIWESGYREDIMIGAPPAGRGPDGEGCVMQVMPQYVASQGVSWLTDEEVKDLTPEQVIQRTLGTDQPSLERCYEAGARMLSRFRNAARYKCKGSWVYGMYSMYGTGGQCYPSRKAANVHAKMKEAVDKGQLNPVMLQGVVEKDWAMDRTKTYEKCMAKWPDKEQMPAWAAATLPASGVAIAELE
jgi:hypothetical protein